MALSVSDYKEIIRLTKEIKEEERELARLKAEGKKIDKERLDTLKAELEVKRKGKEEAESEYKTTEKLYKTASNLSKIIIGNSDKLLERKRKIADYDQSSSDVQLKAADALRKSAEFEDTILRTKSKSNMLSFDSKSMIEEINEQLEIIVEQYHEVDDAQKEILDNTMEDLEKTKEKVKALGKQADKVKGQKAAHDKLNELAGGYVDKLESGILMIKEMGKEIAKNPTVAFTAMGVAVGTAVEKAVNKVKDLQQDMGLAREQAKLLQREFNDVNINLGTIPGIKSFFDEDSGIFAIGPDFFDLFLGTDAGKSAAGLVNEFGNLSVVTEDNADFVSLMGKGLGISADTSGKLLANFMKIRGESMETAQESLKGTAALAIANEIPVNMLMKDLADNTETFAEFSIQGSNNLEMAAVQARRLGVNLSTTAKIANSLLDFESSIEKEMKASLLVGKQLNYNRARQLALEGNIAGAAADVVSQLGGQAGFARLNVIQRRALAESIGVSVEELSRLASGRPLELKSADNESRDKLRKSIDLLTNRADNILGKSGKTIFGGIAALGQLLASFLPDLGVSYLFLRGAKDIKEIFSKKGFRGVFRDMKSAANTGVDDTVQGMKRRLNQQAGMDDILDTGIQNPKKAQRVTVVDASGRPTSTIDPPKPTSPFVDEFGRPMQSSAKPDVPKVTDELDDVAKASKFRGQAFSILRKVGYIGAAIDVIGTGKEVRDLGGIQSKEAQRTVVDSAGGMAGAAAMGTLFAKGGAAIGTMIAPGIGTAIGGVLGGFIGGSLGYFGGEELSGRAFDKLTEPKEIVEPQDAPIQFETPEGFFDTSENTNLKLDDTNKHLSSIVEQDMINTQTLADKLDKIHQELQNINPQRA